MPIFLSDLRFVVLMNVGRGSKISTRHVILYNAPSSIEERYGVRKYRGEGGRKRVEGHESLQLHNDRGIEFSWITSIA